jgi:hypothetical protein
MFSQVSLQLSATPRLQTSRSDSGPFPEAARNLSFSSKTKLLTQAGSWPEAKQAYTLARSLFPEVLPVNGAIMDHAKDWIDSDQTVSARDVVPAAVVVLHKLEGICTFDRDFDRIPGCTRIDPQLPSGKPQLFECAGLNAWI